MNYSKRHELPIVTIAILILNLIGLIYELIVGQSTAIYRFGMYQGALGDGEWPRLIVSAFLHFGFAHFASNMACLVMFGLDLETHTSRWRYALIYGIADSSL